MSLNDLTKPTAHAPSAVSKIVPSELSGMLNDPSKSNTALSVIEQATCITMSQMISKKLDRYASGLNDEVNQSILENSSDFLVEDGHYYAIDSKGVINRFKSYLTSYLSFDSEDGNVKPNFASVVSGFLNVPNQINIIKTSTQIINECNRLNDKYLNDTTSEYYIPLKLEQSCRDVRTKALEDKNFFNEMERFGAENFFLITLEKDSDFMKILDEFGRDMGNLKKLSDNHYKYLKKGGKI